MTQKGARLPSLTLTPGCSKCDALKNGTSFRVAHTCRRRRVNGTSLSGGEEHEKHEEDEEAETDETLRAQLASLLYEAEDFDRSIAQKSSELQTLQGEIAGLFSNIEEIADRMRSKELVSKQTRANFAGSFGLLLNFQSQVLAGQGRKRK